MARQFTVIFITLTVIFAVAMGQRSPYAGSRPVGYKDTYLTKPNQTEDITNRFGEGDDLNTINTPQRPPQGVDVVQAIQGTFIPNNEGVLVAGVPQERPLTQFENRFGGPQQPSATTDRLPFDAHGDAALVQHYNTLPVDKRPFWLINYEAIEAQRNTTRPNNQPVVAGRSSFLGK